MHYEELGDQLAGFPRPTPTFQRMDLQTQWMGQVAQSVRIFTGAGILVNLLLNRSGTAPTLKMYDGIDSNGRLFWDSTIALNGSNFLGVRLSTGLYIINGGTLPASFTVVFATLDN